MNHRHYSVQRGSAPDGTYEQYTVCADRQRRRAGGVVDFYLDGVLTRRFFGMGKWGVYEWDQSRYMECPK